MHENILKHTYKSIPDNRKLLPFKSLFFVCESKLSKTSRLLRQAGSGNCPDCLGCVTARLSTAITCDTDR